MGNANSMKAAIQRVLDAEKLEDGEYSGEVTAARNTKSGVALDVALEDASVTVFVNTVDTERVGSLLAAARALEVDPLELADNENAEDLLVGKKVNIRCRTTKDDARFFDLRPIKDDDSPKKAVATQPKKGKVAEPEEPQVAKPGKLSKTLPKKEAITTYNEGDKVKVDGAKYTVISDDGGDSIVVTDGKDNYEVERKSID